MKKLAALCMVALGATLLVLGTTPSASAYPDLGCDVSVTRMAVKPGGTVTAIGGVVGADSARSVAWKFRWNGATKARTGGTARASFTAPKVKHSRVIRLAGEARTTLAGVPRTCVHHVDITVSAAGATQVSAPGDGGLPGTGGPALWILVAALVLLAAGGGTVVVTRRRSR